MLGAQAVRGQIEPTESSLKNNVSVEEKLRALEESMVNAKAEADYFRKEWMEMSLRHEALGLDALTADERALHERIVSLVAELHQSEQRNNELASLLQNVLEAADALLAAKPEERAAKRAAYEVSVRQARQSLQGSPRSGTPLAKDLTDVIVVHYDGELNLAILNAGRTHGVKTGMPFRILRKEAVIGQCKIFEVREHLSGALVTAIKAETIQPGDRLLLDVTGK